MEKYRYTVTGIIVLLSILCSTGVVSGSGVDVSPVLPQGMTGSFTAGGNATIPAYFFYGEGCIHCENIRPHILALAAKYPDTDLRFFEVYHNATNQEIFAWFNNAYGIKTPGVPTLIVGNHALVGDTEIRENAEPVIAGLLAGGGSPAVNITYGIIPAVSGGGCPAAPAALTLPLVVTCALIDSVNPCAFAVLVFLLLSIVALESRRRVLAVGGAYIAAVFIFYLLSGIGLFSVVQGSGFSQVLFAAAAVLAIILGLVNVFDVLRKGEGFILAIPESKKGVIEHYIRSASLPAAFLLGILVGIFELPCTGGIYLAILSLMSRTLNFGEGLRYLLLYNFIFVLPLIAILLVVSFGLSPETVNSWRVGSRRMLRLIIGIAMIAIGAVMISGWL